ncbi:hypothetical protein B7463_g418, partial [Scytalidium lignicola]
MAPTVTTTLISSSVINTLRTDSPPVTGLKADPSFSRLFSTGTHKDLTPKLGTEFRNIQLSQLTDDQIEDLAAFISTRGVVVFRDQNLSEKEQVAFGQRLGELQEHVHSYGKHPALIPIHVDKNSKLAAGEVWHSDMSEEPFPPAFSILYMEKVPLSGGDTLYANMYAAYDKLSPAMKEVFNGKTAITRRKTSILRPEKVARDTVCSHPIVRTHPVTGWQIIFANAPCTTHIEGMTELESKALLDFLAQHIEKGSEFQIRLHWEARSVAIWDNRAVQHQAVWDYWPHERSGRRVVVIGNTPFYDPEGTTQSAALQGDAVNPKWNRLFEH